MRLSDYEQSGAKLYRHGDFDRLGLATEDFAGKNVLTFCSSAKYLQSVLNNKAITCIIAPQSLKDEIPNTYGILLCETPKTLYYQLHNRFAAESRKKRSKPTIIDASAKVHETAVIAKNNVAIGKNTVIGPHTVIEEFVTIGDDCVIGPNNVLGGPAYQFYRDGEDLINVITMGELVLQDKVETQSSVSIDNAVFKTATVGASTKIDSYAQIAHDFICGKRCYIMAHAVISGRVTMGDDVYIGPSVAIVNGLSIGNHAKASIGSVVTKNIGEREQVSGNFAIDHSRYIDIVKSWAK